MTKIWDAIVSLLNDGISVIPVRDKDETTEGGKVLTRKSPYVKWTKYQHEIITKEELWYQLEKYNTEAVATICGKISGNLEAIDFDVKWYPGIAKLVLDQLKESDPQLLKLLRVHKTPSGGYHILYRVNDGTIPGNKKLSSRLSTEDELKNEPDEKTKCYIETRGEGGYVVAPPSLGYSVARDVPIPVITWEQRELLMSCCLLFNEIVKEEPKYNPLNRTESDYYDVNPFEDYNNKSGDQTLLECGWKFHSQSSKAACFTRPGSKSGGIHAAFLFDKKLYKFFTTNTQFDTTRCYQPATVLAGLKYGGDKKELRKQLVLSGFGKMKPEKEKFIIQRAVLSGMEPPENLSPQAQATFKQLKVESEAKHKFGIFWDMNEKGEIEISREKFYDVANGLGFRLHLGDLVQIEENLIHRRDQRFFYDTVKAYIQEEEPDIQMAIFNSFEEFIERHGVFTISRIMLLDRTILMSDDKDTCYKFFTNGYVVITADGIVFSGYDEIGDGLIWAERIQQRNYVSGQSGGKYLEFLNLACNLTEHEKYIKKIIGYLAHEYKDESTSYIIVLTEECPDPKQGGGSGKNVFSNLFKLTTTFTNKPGAQVKFDENFLQSWNYQRILCISDVPKNFDFIFLKEPSSGNGILKKLYKDQVVVDCQDMPKFLIQTNYSFEIKDGGLGRRIKQIEFTDFFTKCGGVDIHFEAMFPTDWNEKDWIGYDNIILECVQTWLIGGRKIEKEELTKSGWMKQFDQSFGINTREFIDQNFDHWSEQEIVPSGEFVESYKKYCVENSIAFKFQVSMIKLNNACLEWAKSKGYDYDPSYVVRNGLTTQKCKRFFPEIAPF